LGETQTIISCVHFLSLPRNRYPVGRLWVEWWLNPSVSWPFLIPYFLLLPFFVYFFLFTFYFAQPVPHNVTFVEELPKTAQAKFRNILRARRRAIAPQ
jgi:hypothetical protein